MEIKQFLRQAGVLPNINGFKFIIDAVGYIELYPNAKMFGNNSIYGLTAAQNETTESKVERGIRHAIKKMDGEVLKKFGLKDTSPSNSELLYFLAEFVLDRRAS